MSFSIVWKIENFSYCWPRSGDILRSPKFIPIECGGYLQWSLGLFPKGRRKADRIDCRLTREATERSSGLEAEVEFSFLDVAGLPLLASEKIRREFAVGEFHEYSVPRDDVFQRRQALLPHDTLTLRCRVWPCDLEVEPQNMFATTHIRVDRIAFVWTVEEFSACGKNEEKTALVTSASENSPDFRLRLCPRKDEEEMVGVRIVQLNTDSENFVRCRMSLLARNNSVLSMQCEEWYHKYRPKRPWNFPSFLSREKLLKNKELYLPGDALSLRCELNVSLGEWKSADHARPTRTPPKSTSTTGCQTDVQPTAPRRRDRTGINLEDDLKSLYRDGLLCDFTLKADSKTFPVHKSLLVARSAVFRIMFQKGMLEDNYGILEIPDLDPETLKRALAFLYCEELDRSSGWKQNVQLYSMADKYHLLRLKDECRLLLKTGLDTSNAWEMLLLADRHQDEDLKRMVQDFILGQEKSINASKGQRDGKRGIVPPETIYTSTV